VSSSDTAEPTPQGRPPWRALIFGLLIATVVALVGILSLVLGGSHNTASGGSSTAKVGAAVPSFSLPSLSGSGRVGIPAAGGSHGKPAVLIFFASWCGPCQREMPGLAAAVRRGEAGHAAVIGIDGADETAAARRFVASTGMTFPVGRDDVYSVTAGKFGFVGLPETVFVNGRGQITSIHFGATTPALLRQGVAAFGR